MAGGRTHIPSYNADKCLTCGVCTWHCPTLVFTELAEETDSLRGVVFTQRPYEGEKADMPPCRLACPLGQDVPTYISAIARKDLDTAAAVIRETNALPSVCGRVCVASCMRACTRAGVDEGLDIRALKRFAVNVVKEVEIIKDDKKTFASSVAIIGGGPAGLAAAHRLVQLGIKPVVFEAGAQAGGMLFDVIPDFVLPKEMVATDVANLEKMGVEIKTGVSVGKDVTWHELENDYDAILVTTGAGKAAKSPFSGYELEGATDAIDFCRGAKNAKDKIDGPVVVQGGGAAALQAARTAVRLGAKSVSVVHSAPAELWPAGSRAMEVASEEGVELIAEHRVTALSGSKKLESVTIRPVRSPKRDGVGRPEAGTLGKEKKVEAAVFVAAMEDRRPQKTSQPDLNKITRGLLGNLKVDDGYRLARPGWYAAGEAATGSATVVDSMATGRLAAQTIGQDLTKKTEAK